MKAIICVGISASGKSTWAEDLVCNDPQQSWVEINRDNVRFALFNKGVKDWSKYKFTKARENRVTVVIDQLIFDAVMEKKNIVCSDTNLTDKYRRTLMTKLEELGYEVEIKVFDISLEEAWKRDANRQGGVGHTIIYTQYLKYLKFIGRDVYEPDTSKPKAIICDIDGTIADMGGVRGPFDWGKVSLDKPRTEIIQMVEAYYWDSGNEVVFLSGRDGVCYPDTYAWIEEHTSIQNPILHMRQPDDCRKDTIIKEELFWKYISHEYNVVGAIDDRPCMVRLWNELKIPNVICVGDPWKEF